MSQHALTWDTKLHPRGVRWQGECHRRICEAENLCRAYVQTFSSHSLQFPATKAVAVLFCAVIAEAPSTIGAFALSQCDSVIDALLVFGWLITRQLNNKVNASMPSHGKHPGKAVLCSQTYHICTTSLIASLRWNMHNVTAVLWLCISIWHIVSELLVDHVFTSHLQSMPSAHDGCAIQSMTWRHICAATRLVTNHRKSANVNCPVRTYVYTCVCNSVTLIASKQKSQQNSASEYLQGDGYI